MNTVPHLFHGSSKGNIKLFEPRQAITFGRPDGQPAVHATDEIEAAIFMAVLGSRHVGGWGLKNTTKFGFFIIDIHFEEAKKKNWLGYVYSLPSQTFYNRRKWEWISTKPIKPLDSFAVGIENLPKNIYIMTSKEYRDYNKSQSTLQ